MVVIGGTVTRIAECGGFVFVTVADAEGGGEVQFQLRKDDPRVAKFGFRDTMVVEAHLVSDLDAVAKTVAWHNGETH